MQRKEDLSRAPHGQGSSGKKKNLRDEMSLGSGDEFASRAAVNSTESAKRKIVLNSSHKSTPAEKKLRRSSPVKLPSHGKKADPFAFDDAGPSDAESDSSAASGSQKAGRNRTPVKKSLSQETSSDSDAGSDE